MKTSLNLPALLALSILLSACPGNSLRQPASEASGLPLLANEQNLGIFPGFNPSLPAATADSLENDRQEALDAGMSIARLQIDWPELEPAENIYDLTGLEDRLVELSSEGLQVMLCIPAYDSEGPVLPAGLGGLPMDSHRVIARFDSLMQRVIPLLDRYGAWAIVVCNEPDNQYDSEKGLWRQIRSFLTAVREKIHELNPQMAVSVTMNAGNMQHSLSKMKKVRDACDFVSMNFYGSDIARLDRPFSKKENEDALDDILRFCGSRQLVFQEIGMHSDSLLLHSSERIQQEFFETLFERLKNEKRFRAAFVFQLVDWSPEAIAVFNDLFEAELPQSFIDQYSAVLASLGVVDYNSGRRKKAWKSLLNIMRDF